MDISFSELPENEQAKDLHQYEIAKNMACANPYPINETYYVVKDIIELLEVDKTANENNVYQFHQLQGINLYALYDTKETAKSKINYCEQHKKNQQTEQSEEMTY